MKKTFTAAVAALMLVSSVPSYASHVADVGSPATDAAYDVMLMRPIGLISVGVGAAAFIIGLPFTFLLGESGRSAEELVAAPFNYTFTRPIGDLGPLEFQDYAQDLPRVYRTFTGPSSGRDD